MNLVKRNIIALVLIGIFSLQSYGQTFKPLSLGDRIPFKIWKTLSIKKDTKLVVLDFWSTTCSSCIVAFPNINSLSQYFKNELQVVLVNSWETERQVVDRIAFINSKKIKNGDVPLALPSAHFIYGDTIFCKLFPLITIPHHVWLNQEGVVQAITYGYNLTKESVQAFIDGKKSRLVTKDDIAGASLSSKGFLRPTLANRYPSYYSAFIPFYPAVYNTIQSRDSVNGTFRKTFYNRSILDLYKTAFVVFQKTLKSKRIIVESNLEEWFRKMDQLNESGGFDVWREKYTFSYEIQGALSSEKNWQNKMQIDVNMFFGDMLGLVGEWQKRKLTSLILIKEKSLLEESSSKNKEYIDGENLFKFTNYPFSEAINYLSRKLEDMNVARPFLDETGIEINKKVDFQLIGDIKDIGLLRIQLQNYGLNLIEAEREVDVFVISDKK